MPLPLKLEVDVSCTKGGRIAGFAVALDDIRDLPLGEYAMPTWTTGIDEPSEDARVIVLSTTGAGAAYPRIVTPDFSKSLEIQFLSGSVDASLLLELEARNFEAKPNQGCSVCEL